MRRIISAISYGVLSLAINAAMICGIAWILPLGGLEYGVKLVAYIFLYGACQIVLFDPLSAAIYAYRKS